MCGLHPDARRCPQAERSAPAPNMRSRAPTCASEQGELGSEVMTQRSGGRTREPLTQVRTPAGAFIVPRAETTRSHIEHAHDLWRSYPKRPGRARAEAARPRARTRRARTTQGAHAWSPNVPGCTRVEPERPACTRVEPEQPRAHTRGARTTQGAHARSPHVRTKWADVPQMWTGLRLILKVIGQKSYSTYIVKPSKCLVPRTHVWTTDVGLPGCAVSARATAARSDGKRGDHRAFTVRTSADYTSGVGTDGSTRRVVSKRRATGWCGMHSCGVRKIGPKTFGGRNDGHRTGAQQDGWFPSVWPQDCAERIRAAAGSVAPARSRGARADSTQPPGPGQSGDHMWAAPHRTCSPQRPYVWSARQTCGPSPHVWPPAAPNVRRWADYLARAVIKHQKNYPDGPKWCTLFRRRPCGAEVLPPWKQENNPKRRENDCFEGR